MGSIGGHYDNKIKIKWHSGQEFVRLAKAGGFFRAARLGPTKMKGVLLTKIKVYQSRRDEGNFITNVVVSGDNTLTISYSSKSDTITQALTISRGGGGTDYGSTIQALQTEINALKTAVISLNFRVLSLEGLGFGGGLGGGFGGL